jgi:hypothetical protein
MKVTTKPLQKHTLNLYAGELERLQELYGIAKASDTIRKLVHNHLRKCEERAARRLEELGYDLTEEVL